ncbi:MAG: T9SS type A sorting domain-containing protein [Bacteroidetes bacterium]|nr:T9SS type A sorting domain-containing protein [Bacteroidota bacterium]
MKLLEEAFVVYPIPCKDELTLSVNAKIRESVTIELYGASGSKLVTLFDGLVDSALSEFNFSLKKFPPGVYYLNCISKRGVVVKWIVKV